MKTLSALLLSSAMLLGTAFAADQKDAKATSDTSKTTVKKHKHAKKSAAKKTTADNMIAKPSASATPAPAPAPAPAK
jgi:hypothetical protein